MIPLPPTSTLFPYTTLFRSARVTWCWSATTVTPRVSPRAHASTAAQTKFKHRLGFPIQPSSERRSEEHTSELQSQFHLVCRLLLEKKNRSATASTWGAPTHC